MTSKRYSIFLFNYILSMLKVRIGFFVSTTVEFQTDNLKVGLWLYKRFIAEVKVVRKPPGVPS